MICIIPVACLSAEQLKAFLLKSVLLTVIQDGNILPVYMSQNSGSFYCFFSSSSFSSANLRKNKGFLLTESAFFCFSKQKKKNRLKRTVKKNRLLGTYKPANFTCSKIAVGFTGSL